MSGTQLDRWRRRAVNALFDDGEEAEDMPTDEQLDTILLSLPAATARVEVEANHSGAWVYLITSDARIALRPDPATVDRCCQYAERIAVALDLDLTFNQKWVRDKFYASNGGARS